MKLKRTLVTVVAIAVAAALLCACQFRTSRAPMRSTAPMRSLAPTAAPKTAAATRSLPSVPPGKTASQDTKGAVTTIPEEAAAGNGAGSP
jgi:hypothetical protein